MPSKNKRGISSIIATLLLVVLTIALVAIVWGVVNSLVGQKISQTSACFGNYNTITIGSQYTCYNNISNQISLNFSINIGSINVDGVLISISSPSKSQSITINNTASTIPNLMYYNGTASVALPGENSGMTYVYNWTGTDIPSSIQIAPIVKGQQCAASDSLTTIEDCGLLS